MLVLTRRVGEGVMIGTNIHVVVLELRGGEVRLGIDVPATIPVHRDEIAAKLRRKDEEEQE
jgi:carbon storage regulator